MECQSQNPEFRIYPENFHPCIFHLFLNPLQINRIFHIVLYNSQDGPIVYILRGSQVIIKKKMYFFL